MSKKLGMCSSLITFISVLAYGVIILTISISNHENIVNRGAFFTSIFIGLGFLGMIYSYFTFTKNEDKSSGFIALIISTIHAIVLIVIHYNQYFRTHIDIIYFELFYTMKMFGYVLLSVATLFIAFAFEANNKKEQLLKLLLYIHCIFGLCFFVILIGMILNINILQNNNYRLIIKIWCIYFSIICILSYIHFKNKSHWKQT